MNITMTSLKYIFRHYPSDTPFLVSTLYDATRGAIAPTVFERVATSKRHLMHTNSAFFLVLLGMLYMSPCQAAEADSQSSGVVQKVGDAIERGAEAAVSGVQRGAKAAAHGVERAADATARGVKAAAKGVERGATAAADGVETAANKVKCSDTPDSSDSQ
jgi:hypothetical protein